MTEISQQITNNFKVRKNKKQKQAFRNYICQQFENVKVTDNDKLFGSKNIVVGDVRHAKVVLTAHYDTPPALPFPNFITPKNLFVFILYQIVLTVFVLAMGVGFALLVNALWAVAFNYTLNGSVLFLLTYIFVFWLLLGGIPNKNNYNDNTSGVVTLIELMQSLAPEQLAVTAFVFFDNEEKGLLGSMAFKKQYGKLPNKLLINFDCVGDGDHALFVCNKVATAKFGEKINQCMVDDGDKKAVICSTKNTVYPSDQSNFSCTVAVAFAKKAKVIGYYLDKIHTCFDKNLDGENISYLTKTTSNLIDSLINEN